MIKEEREIYETTRRKSGKSKLNLKLQHRELYLHGSVIFRACLYSLNLTLKH